MQYKGDKLKETFFDHNVVYVVASVASQWSGRQPVQKKSALEQSHEAAHTGTSNANPPKWTDNALLSATRTSQEYALLLRHTDLTKEGHPPMRAAGPRGSMPRGTALPTI